MHPKRKSYDNPNYEKFIRSKPCIVCGVEGVDLHHMYHARRNVFLATPLCRRHHTFGPDAYHILEHNKFEAVHNLDADWHIINLLSEYIERGK